MGPTAAPTPAEDAIGRMAQETGPNDTSVVWAQGKLFYVRFLSFLLSLTFVFVPTGV
jgi:hypothetical protein